MAERSIQDCVKHLLDMFKSGEFDFMCAANCAAYIVWKITENFVDHDDQVIGDATAGDMESLLALASQPEVAVPVPLEGPISNAFLLALAKKLMELALEWFNEN